MHLWKNLKHYKKKLRRSMFADWCRGVWRDPTARSTLFLFIAFTALAVFSFITSQDYRVQDLAAARQGPSAEHLFGTDLLGRDMLTRVSYASRITITLTFMTVLFGASVVPIVLGTLPIFYSKKADFITLRTGEALGGLPPLFTIIILTAVLRPVYDDFVYESNALGEWIVTTGMADLALIMFVTTLIAWVGPARMYRSMVIQLREAPFVERARMLGASRTRVLFRHVLPQIYPFALHAMLSALAGVIATEIALSFLGIGIRAPYPSFGAMFSQSASVRLLNSSPHLLLFPAVVVSLFLLGIRIMDIRSTVILRRLQEGGEV